ncbi:MAG: hypothetical protein HUJ65_04895, partial [Oscillospiraceae bacterium]|nr:hypothetical protein [Oscillospiraceae bacterium]
KCFVTHDAIKANGALFGRDTIVITLQNGLGTQELLREHFDDKSIGYGLMKASALQFAPGKIYGRPHFAESPRGIYYRPIDLNSPYYAKFAEIGEALNRGGLPAELAEGIDEIIWSKLYNNCLFNGIGALLQLPNEISSNHPDGLALMEHIGREVCTVAQAKGFDMDPDTFWREHGGRVILPEGGKLHFTSAVLDAYKKSRTEIDFMNGAVVCEGKKLGIECPYNETIWRLVHIMQSTYNDRYIPE